MNSLTPLAVHKQDGMAFCNAGAEVVKHFTEQVPIDLEDLLLGPKGLSRGNCLRSAPCLHLNATR